MLENYQKAKKLQGTWGHRENWAEYTVRVTRGKIIVSAQDADDGENYPISNVLWDGNTLSFDCSIPSQDWSIHHTLVPNRGATVKHVTVFKDILVKRKSTCESIETARRPRVS
jgi:hypothetical protein